MSYSDNRVVQEVSNSSILSRNKVLRQTYVLLALTVLFSSLCAYIGTVMHVQIPVLAYMIGFFGLVIAIQKKRNSGWGIILLFAFTGFVGFSISSILNAYISFGLGDTIVKALAGSAIIFLGLSAYVLVSGKNFNFLGGFLFVGILTAFLAGIANIFFEIPALSVVTSSAFLLIFSGYVLYDTSKIMRGEEDNYITATLSLFINLLNIFLSLLNILGIFSND